MLTAGAASLQDVRVEGATTWWLESRPEEAGRYQIVRRDPDGTQTDLLPDGFGARTRVHEYGGGSFLVDRGVVYFSNWADQRLYRLEPGGEPVATTPEPPEAHALRYADGVCTPDGAWVICVREAHDGPSATQVRNEIVAVRADGSAGFEGPREPCVLASGRDFVSTPRISRDGRQLAWITWDHPNMPWDDTELWVGHLHDDGEGKLVVDRARRVAGRPGESVMQPAWGRHGSLFVISDRTDWWNVYGVEGPDALAPVHPLTAEVGGPQWVFGESDLAIAVDGTIVFAHRAQGGVHLVVVPDGGEPTTHQLPFVALDHLRLADGRVTAMAGSTDVEPQLIRFPLDRPDAIEVLRPPRDLGLDPAGISPAIPISFPSADGRLAHALYYAPVSATHHGPEGERPPLVVLSHGGPTSAAQAEFYLARQFWTSRGFALVDVDYGGSTGYGRAYRELLNGRWGVVDVEDCCAAASFLAAEGRVDGERLAIRGGSAGGFTTLAALAFRDVFSVGGDYYGVADLSALAADTHKFESRYLDRLVGPWPEAKAVYDERSPIHHVDGFDRPLIVFQGLEDQVVPPNQSEMIVAALQDKGVRTEYHPYEGEQHGFRQAANIIDSLQRELGFYRSVFRIEASG
jgi:dipeptidyl aminopeptidase/acylaminoacyl peptidase